MAEPTVKRGETNSGGLVSLMRPYATKVALVVGLLALLAMTNMALPFTLKLLLDDVFPSEARAAGNWGLLWLILPGLLMIYLLRNLLFYMSRMISVHVSEDLCFRLRRRLFEHLQQLSLSYYKSNQPGKVASRLMDDTFKIQSFIQDKLPTFLLNVLLFQILLVVLYTTNWRLALVSTIVLPLHLATYYRFKRSMRRSQSESQEHLASAYGDLIERFLGIEVVKGFTAEERETAMFNTSIDRSRQSQIRTQRLHFVQKVIADLLIGAGTVVLLGFGAVEVRGGMSPGSFFMFFGYVCMLYPAVVEIMTGTSYLSKTSACVDRVLELLMEPVVGHTADRGRRLPTRFRGVIVMDEVTFNYGNGKPVLQDLSLTISPGDHVAVVGPSGAGKSTMAYLIPRFIEPTGGHILVDGMRVSDWPTTTLRSHIGIAFQEVFLFNTSIYENLRYARPEATEEEIVRVCKLTGAHEVVSRLPEGYQTQIGASGVELSRGEKQRITLARSLLKNPDILILDEATASLDRESAEKVMQAIIKEMEGRTLIIITHETNMIGLVDRVLHIDGGKVLFDASSADYLEQVVLAESSASSAAAMVSGLTPTARQLAARAARGRRGGARGPKLLGALLALGLLVAVGCKSTTAGPDKVIELDEPKANTGWLVTGDDLPDLEELAKTLDTARTAAAQRLAPPPRTGNDELRELAPPTVDDGPVLTHGDEVAGSIISLPSMSRLEIEELLASAVLKLGTDAGFAAAANEQPQLPTVPDRVEGLRTLRRESGERQLWLRLGYTRALTQPPTLWLQCSVLGGVGMAAAQEAMQAEALLAELVEKRQATRSFIPWVDLNVDVVTLSYVDPVDALKALARLGITTLKDADATSTDVDFQQLPLVAGLPSPTDAATGLVGEQEVNRDRLGLTLMPSVASKLPALTIGSPTTELLVFYHPAFPEQLTRVRNALTAIVDVPARQIFVEGLVLEISEEGLKELGITWAFKEGRWLATGGALTPATALAEGTLGATVDSTTDFPRQWQAKLRALIQEGKAEILSRPSVLALDNRQAVIRVGRDVPIASSGTIANNNKLSFSFQYIPTGILLNIRPRITEDTKQISMLVDTTVSATVPGGDLEVRDIDGTLLAQAPTISIRRVQTYARIANNTPFIVGGLVSRETTTEIDRVPILSKLPLLGQAFQARREQVTSREVIIVLTPYILPLDHYVARSLPKDEEHFNSFGRKLFRDFYRLRAEDMYDLEFLTQNARLKSYRALVQHVLRQNALLAEQSPFQELAGGRIPGEQVLIHRMTYDVIKRLNLDENLAMSKLLFLERKESGGYGVAFLPATLSKYGDGSDPMSFFRDHPDKALAITYSYDRTNLSSGSLISEPIPAVNVVSCPDRDAWRTLLWNLNRPTRDGMQHYTVLIHRPEDVERLRRAVILKQTMTLNYGGMPPSLDQFSLGKVLMLPAIDPEQTHLLDADVAKYFFHSEHYYDILNQIVERYLRVLDMTLRQPEMDTYLRGQRLPPPPPADAPVENGE